MGRYNQRYKQEILKAWNKAERAWHLKVGDCRMAGHPVWLIQWKDITLYVLSQGPATPCRLCELSPLCVRETGQQHWARLNVPNGVIGHMKGFYYLLKDTRVGAGVQDPISTNGHVSCLCLWGCGIHSFLQWPPDSMGGVGVLSSTLTVIRVKQWLALGSSYLLLFTLYIKQARDFGIAGHQTVSPFFFLHTNVITVVGIWHPLLWTRTTRVCWRKIII